jgi:hypothetical protein
MERAFGPASSQVQQQIPLGNDKQERQMQKHKQQQRQRRISDLVFALSGYCWFE